METIKINDDEFLTLNDAENYLDEPSAIFQLEVCFFKYKGFAEMTELLDKPQVCTYRLSYEGDSSYEDDLYYVMDSTFPEKVYINGLVEIKIKPVTQAFHDGADYFINSIECFIGLVGGEKKEVSRLSIPSTQLNLYDGCNYNDDILVKLSDLDALAEKYGIPKKAVALPISENCNQLAVPPELTKTKTPEMQRKNDFNTYFSTSIDDFINRNGYKPTAEIVIHELTHKPQEGEIIDFKGNTLSINGASPRKIENVTRTINNLLKNIAA